MEQRHPTGRILLTTWKASKDDKTYNKIARPEKEDIHEGEDRQDLEVLGVIYSYL